MGAGAKNIMHVHMQQRSVEKVYKTFFDLLAGIAGEDRGPRLPQEELDRVGLTAPTKASNSLLVLR